MSDDEQMTMDLGVEVTRTAWGDWVDPDRLAARVTAFRNRVGLPAFPAEPWDFESVEVIEARNEIEKLFPDVASVALPENAETADEFACFVGHLFVRYLDARWIDLAEAPPGYNDTNALRIYESVKPGVAFTFPGWTACTADLLVEFVVVEGFLRLMELISPAHSRLHTEGGFEFGELSQQRGAYPPFM
ncbi:hypothetical protein ACWDYH_02520 [Nocardia goodfellowii]